MDTAQNRLLHGSVAKGLILFAAPIILSNLLQNLYAVVDLVAVGQLAGTNSLSGVSIGSNVTNLLTNLCIGLCQGGVALIGQYLGSKNTERLQRAVNSLLTGVVILALAITLLMVFLEDPILTLMQTPAESFSEAHNYLLICSVGMVFLFGYNALSSILRGIGDSRTPLIFVLIACCINIVLDLAMVGGLGLGAAGAALATVIAQMISMLLCIIHISRNVHRFGFRLQLFRWDRSELKLLLQFGSPTCLQNGVTSLSFVVLTSISNSLGVAASAAAATGSKLNSFGILPCIANTAAISSMVAINEGAGQRERSIQATKIGLVMIYCFNIVIFAVLQLFTPQLVGIFSSDAEVVYYGVLYIRSLSIDLLFVPVLSAFSGLFIGTGHTVVTSILNAFSALVIRIPVAAFCGLVLGWGMRGVGMGAPVSSLIVGIICIIYYLSGKWKVRVIKNLDKGAADSEAI